MPNLIAWLTILNSLVLTLLGVIQTIKYWKKPKIEIEIGLPMGTMEVKNGIKWVNLKNIQIHIVNSGNEDVLIRNLKIEHIEATTKLSSWKNIAYDFHLPALKSIDYVVNNTISYNPRENERGGKWDNIHVIAEYGKKKKSWEKLYFIMNEKSGQIEVYSSESSWRKM